MTAGKLIVFEGIDGMGKSSQLQLLAAALRQRGLPVVITREPTDGPHGLVIRDILKNRVRYRPQQELAAFIADRRQHVEEFLAPQLAAGNHVLCDRYYLSTIAYQGAMGVDPREIIAAHSFAPPPDLALLLEAEPGVGLSRIHERGDTPNDFERLNYLEKVREVFNTLSFPFIRRIDASQRAETVHRQIVEATLPLFGEPRP
ncbi:MAG: dTMP kinase [Desulfobulbaceae bacterium]|jgi:dTMP kinase|nr:dTMP kinase [Desulfobulbaceae bacterium]